MSELPNDIYRCILAYVHHSNRTRIWVILSLCTVNTCWRNIIYSIIKHLLVDSNAVDLSYLQLDGLIIQGNGNLFRLPTGMRSLSIYSTLMGYAITISCLIPSTLSMLTTLRLVGTIDFTTLPSFESLTHLYMRSTTVDNISDQPALTTMEIKTDQSSISCGDLPNLTDLSCNVSIYNMLHHALTLEKQLPNADKLCKLTLGYESPMTDLSLCTSLKKLDVRKRISYTTAEIIKTLPFGSSCVIKSHLL